jgi:hypothetical protein
VLQRAVVASVVVGVVTALTSAAASGSTSGFLVGFDDDLAKQVGSPATTPMRQLGAGAVRVTLQWVPGSTTLTTADITGLNTAVSAATKLRIVLSVYGSTATAAPVTATARSQYCSYVASALRRYAAIRDVVIWNEPNKVQFWSPQAGAPAAYEALLATCYDALHASFASVNVLGLALSHAGNDNSSSTSPGAFIRGVGTAYRASAHTKRILDTVAFHPYPVTSSERPWLQHIGSTTIGEGDWNKLMYNLWQAFNATAQPLPGQANVRIWYTEWGVQTAIPAAKASLYSGTENVAVLPETSAGDPTPPPPGSPAPDAATQFNDAVSLAACQPHVAAFFNFLVADEARLSGWQSGPLYTDRTAKTLYGSYQQTIAAASAAAVDCTKLKGGTPSPDYLPPTAPSNLTAAVSPPNVTLSWNASTDDASAISYRIYRGAAFIATTTATTWTGTSPSGASVYTVRAIDAAGNLGNASNSVTVTG